MRVSELFFAVCATICVLQVAYGSNDGLTFQCRDGWSYYEGVCYRAYSIPMSWDEAAATCRRQGGELFDPAIQEVFNYLRDEMEGLPNTFWTSMKTTDSTVEDLQVISPWADYEPRVVGESCIAMTTREGYARKNCNMLDNVVCEYNACLSGFVPCALGSKCINETRSLCNGVYECEDRSDERDCSNACKKYSLIPDDITSSGFSTSTISSGKDCWWTFEAPVGKLIRLFVPTMNLERGLSYLHILTGSPSVKDSRSVEDITGTITQHYVYSDNNFLHVRLYAGDISAPSNAITFTWQTVSDMRAQENVLEATNEDQSLKFPFSSEEFGPQGMTVYWRITAPEGELITYNVESTLMGGVVSSPVMIRYGMNDNWRYISQNLYGTTRSNALMVQMAHSDNIRYYTLKYRIGCDITISKFEGIITSPGFFVDEIPHELTCKWTLTAGQTESPPIGMTVTITVADLASDPRQGPGSNSTMDTIQVFGDNDVAIDGSGGRFSAAGGRIKIMFNSDVTVHSKGFAISFGADCTPLDVSAETIKSTNDSYYNFPVDLSCPTGYQFNLEKYKNEESVTATCRVEGFVLGDGSKVIPECQVVRCGTPPKINNGYIVNATKTSYGGNATYACDTGFGIKGDSVVTCNENGEWVTPPMCTSSACPYTDQMLAVANGEYVVEAGNELANGFAEFNVVLKFQCDDGYELIGQQRTQCTAEGWKHSTLPTCQKLRCVLPEVSNAEPWDSTTIEYEGTAVFSCKEGYEGSQTVICLANQTLDKELSCTNINECADAVNPCNLNKETCQDTDPGHECLCNAGYMKDTNNVCQDILECGVGNGGCSQSCAELSGSYRCECPNEGYELFTENGQHGHTIPDSETGHLPGDVYRFNHTCVRIACHPLETVTYGRYSSNDDTLLFGDNVTLTCEDGYALRNGSLSVTFECKSNRTLPVHACYPRGCVIPTPPTYGSFNKESVMFKESVQLTCQYSDTRNITRTAYCIYDNGDMRLGGENINECPAIDCGTPALPTGGRPFVSLSSTLFLENPSFVFSCDDGYDLFGESGDLNPRNVTCKPNGRWDFGTLRCEGKRCTDPGTPVDAQQIATTYERGATLTYKCVRNGFAPLLNGQERNYTCDYDAPTNTVNWSNSLSPNNLPTCTDVTNPVATFCPENMSYFPMDSVVVQLPNFMDNSGINTESRTNYMATGDVITTAQQFNFTVTDFETRAATCLFTFDVLDRNDKPVLTCPPYQVVRVDSSDDGRQEVQDFVTIMDPDVSRSVSPATIQRTVGQIGTSQIAAVSVTDEFERRSECTFMIHFEAGKCFQEALYPDENADRSCVQTETGLSCNSTCKANHVFADGTNSKTFVCADSNQDWNFPGDLDIFCLPIQNPAYQSDITLDYRYGSVASTCQAQFHAELDNELSQFVTNIRTQISACNGMTWTVTRLTEGSSVALFQFTVALRMSLQSTSYTSEQKRQCVEAVQAGAATIFQINDNRLTCANVIANLTVSEATNSMPQLSCVSPSFHLRTDTNSGDVCVPCGPGYFYDDNTDTCVRCSDGQYQDLLNQMECKTCPSASAPDPQQIDCDNTCPAGFTSDDGFYPCTPCGTDTYWVDSKTCSPCPDSRTTVGLQGAKSTNECYEPCPAGSFSSTGYSNVRCEQCPVGFYRPEVGQQDCRECSQSQTTNGTGKTLQSECENLSTCESFGCNTDGMDECRYVHHRPVCVCQDGYVGEKCQHKNEICDSDPCTTGAECEPVPGGTNLDFTCSCRTDLDVCTMVLDNENMEIETPATYASTIGLTENDCKAKCINDEMCVGALYAVNEPTRVCLLYNTSSVTLEDFTGDSSLYFVKNCSTAFSGARCEIDTSNDCDDAGCADGSMCKDKVNDTECLCPTGGGFSGPKCRQEVTLCTPNPCKNNGVCRAYETVRYECTCLDGYTGENCETQIDECELNPDACLFGGTCQPLVDDYSCTCNNTFVGDNCQTVPDFCSISNNCQGNPCISSTDDNQGKCFCEAPLFENDGDFSCNKTKEPCDDQQCENGGTCTNSNDGLSATCTCVAGWTGSLCQHNIDDCTADACKNGGTCNDNVMGFNCTCAAGYNGTACENDIDDCVDKECGNGECVDGIDTYTCDCASGYTGTMCEIEINECSSFPCQHDGTCSDLLNDYNCACEQGWTGKSCQSEVDACDTNTCQNDGQCFTIVESPICRCQGGTQGAVCENPSDICDVLSDADLCQNNGVCQNKDGTAVCICETEYNINRCYFTDGQVDTSGGLKFFNTSTTATSETFCKDRCLVLEDCDGVTYGNGFCFFYNLSSLAVRKEDGLVHFNRICPTDYSGASCECIKDWCSNETLCQNGGTCRATSPKGYTCDCREGYDGVHCENAPDPCESSPCGTESTSGAKCISTVDEYYCQCPNGRTFNGNLCKEPDADFNLLVDNLDGRMKTGLNSPFRLESNAVSIMMRVRIYDYEDGAEIFELFSSKGANPMERSFTMSLKREGSVAKVSVTTDLMPITLEMETDVFDGDWHHIGVAIDEAGMLSSTIDARTVAESKNIGQMLQFNDNVWLNIGKNVIAEYKEVTVWKQHLDSGAIVLAFAGVSPSVEPIQGWWNYKLPRSTALLSSDLGMGPVPNNTMMPPVLDCSTTKSPVEFVLGDRFVPRDNIVDLKTNLETIEGNNPNLDIQNNLPSELPWGWKAGIVIGQNEYGYGECRFPVYIKYNDKCPVPFKLSDDVMYTQCTNGDGVCSVTCSGTSEGVSASLPRYTPCSGLGVYDIQAPHDDLYLPACNAKASPKYVITARMQFKFQIKCNLLGTDLTTEVTDLIKDTFIDLNTNKWTDICDDAVCTNIQVQTASCSGDVTTPDRFDLEFKVQLANDYLTYTNDAKVGAEDAIRMIVKLDEDVSLKNTGSGQLLADSVEINWSEECTTPGSILVLEPSTSDTSVLNKVCVPCGPGSYYSEPRMGGRSRQGECVPCPKGQYQDELGKMECKPCGNDQTTGSPRTTYRMFATSVDQCKAICAVGQYYNRETLRCDECERHYFQNETGQKYCKPCPIRFKTARAGSTSYSECKEDCPAGKYRDPITQQCLNCSRGSWRSLDLDDCQACPGVSVDNTLGTTTMLGELGVSEASCSMDTCNPGTYWNITEKKCVDCAVGYYQPATAMLMCEKCPGNYTTKGAGSNAEEDCQFYCAVGYQVNDVGARDTCSQCPRGTYKDNDGMTKFDPCKPCPDEKTTDITGAISDASCSIPVCVKGQKIESGVCVNCPADTYSDVELPLSTTSCVECSDDCDTCGNLYGTNKTGASDRAECILYCGPGEELVNQVCMPCERGYYKDNSDDASRFGMCTVCTNSDSTTDESGSKSANDCNIRKCSKGQVLSTVGNCVGCPVDTYSIVELPVTSTACVACTGDCVDENCLFGTNNTGASSLSECTQYCGVGEELIGGVCTSCDRGFYKDNADDASRFGTCKECPDPNFTTDGPGSTNQASCNISVCSAGEYVDERRCVKCEANTYQPLDTPRSQTRCLTCPAIGDVATGTRSEGSDNEDDCIPICDGGKQYDVPAQQCTDCPMGSYKEAGNKFDNCVACDAGYTTMGPGAVEKTECNLRDCQPGTFINMTDECEPCPKGQYQDEPRKTACKMCGSQLNTAETGSVNSDACQIDCDPGNQGISIDGNPKICQICPEHFYKPNAGLSPCQECDPNFTSNEERTACPDLYCYFGNQYVTDSNGTPSCVECEEGFFKASKGNDVPCVACQPGLTTDGMGQKECNITHCVPGLYLDSATETCSVCEVGTYKSMAGNMACTPCPESKTTLDTGATAQTQCDISICPIGQYRDPPNKDCSICPSNNYQDKTGQTSCTACQAGFITLAPESTASTDCVPECQLGEQYEPTSESCTPCPVGTYKNVVGNAENACTACPTDKTTIGTGSTSSADCSQTICPEGTYADVSSGQVTCMACAVGTYSDRTGQRACTPCVQTSTTLRGGSDNSVDCVEKCAVGKGYVETAKACSPCPQGQYNDLLGAEPNKCKVCPAGKTTLKSESRECTINDPQPVVGSGLIEAIANMTYQVDIDNCNTAIDLVVFGISNTVKGHFNEVQRNEFNQSTICAGSTCDNIRVTLVQDSCAALRRKRAVDHELTVTVQFLNVSALLVDDMGRLYRFEDILSRILTTDGKELSIMENDILFESFDNLMTKPVCIAGERVNIAVCEQCPAGSYESNGICNFCGTNTYQDLTGQTSCKSCPEKTVNTGQGATSMSACEPECQLGQQYVSSSKTCTPCPTGFYKDSVGNDLNACIACPPRITTIGDGSISASDCNQAVCQAGTYGVVTEGSLVCRDCPIGSYTSSSGQTECQLCPSARTTLRTASDSSADCVVNCILGSGFVEVTETCVPCPQGKFNDRQGSDPNKCKVCPTGTTNLRAGQTSCPNSATTPPTTATNTINVNVVVKMRISISSCSDDLGVIVIDVRRKFRARFKTVNDNQYGRSSLCRGANCDNLQVSIVVGSCIAIGGSGRRRRAVNHELDMNVDFNNVSDTVVDNSDSQYATEDIVSKVLFTDKAELSPSEDIVLFSAEIPTSTPVCVAGQEVNSNGVCAPCQPGSYGVNNGTCLPCGMDTYQNFVGETSCKDCPDNTLNDGLGADSLDMCISYCVANPTYCNNRGTCKVTGRRTARCECFEDYSGETCLGKNEPTSNMPVILGAAIGGGGAFLIILLIVVGVYRYLSNKEDYQKRKRTYENEEFGGPAYDRNAYDNFTMTSGSNQPRPLGPYPSIGYPALGYRPELSLEEAGYASVYRNRPTSQEEDTFVWQA